MSGDVRPGSERRGRPAEFVPEPRTSPSPPVGHYRDQDAVLVGARGRGRGRPRRDVRYGRRRRSRSGPRLATLHQGDRALAHMDAPRTRLGPGGCPEELDAAVSRPVRQRGYCLLGVPARRSFREQTSEAGEQTRSEAPGRNAVTCVHSITEDELAMVAHPARDLATAHLIPGRRATARVGHVVVVGVGIARLAFVRRLRRLARPARSGAPAGR